MATPKNTTVDDLLAGLADLKKRIESEPAYLSSIVLAPCETGAWLKYMGVYPTTARGMQAHSLYYGVPLREDPTVSAGHVMSRYSDGRIETTAWRS